MLDEKQSRDPSKAGVRNVGKWPEVIAWERRQRRRRAAAWFALITFLLASACLLLWWSGR